MKNIEEEAKMRAKELIIIDNYKKFSSEPDRRTAEYLGYQLFKAGVEFVLKWISVEEELPDINTLILMKKDNNIESMTISLISTDYDVAILTSYYTHWRPIDLK